MSMSGLTCQCCSLEIPTMQTILNIINSHSPNSIINLDLKTKTEILHHVAQTLIYPSTHVLTTACDIDEVRKTETKGTDLVTLSEYLVLNNTEMTPGDFKRFAMEVALCYKTKYQSKPKRTYRPDSKGRWIIKSYGFSSDEVQEIVRPIFVKYNKITYTDATMVKTPHA